MTQILTTEEIESFVINRTGSLDDMIRDVETAVLEKLASGQEPVGEREAFAAWCNNYFGPLRTNAETSLMWTAWQARATHNIKECQ